MPSRLVDEAWHALILDSVAYIDLCRRAYGSYLHHHPAEKAGADTFATLANTVWAWDRSAAGRDHESYMWALDRRATASRIRGDWASTSSRAFARL